MKSIILYVQKNFHNTKSIPKKIYFIKWINQVLHKKKNTYIMTIRIVDEKEISYLNFMYRKCNTPTNILSFQYNQIIKKRHILLGDLILCKNIIEKEAIKYKKNIYSRWAHMIIHGTLHLLGYDHKEKKDKLRMESIENKIMSHFNYPMPYLLNND